MGGQDVIAGQISGGRPLGLHLLRRAGGEFRRCDQRDDRRPAARLGRRRAAGRAARRAAGDRRGGVAEGAAASRYEARSPSTMCPSAIRRGPTRWRSTISICGSRRARRWRSSGPRVRARRRSSTCCCASTIPERGAIRHRRRRHPRPAAGRAAPGDGDRAAGAGAVHRLGRREHPLRPARTPPTPRSRAAAEAASALDLHRGAAAGLRHPSRHPRRAAVGRPAPAHRGRAGRCSAIPPCCCSTRRPARSTPRASWPSSRRSTG